MLPKHEPDFPSAAPDRPNWLSEEACKEWDRVVPLLLEAGLMSPAYRAVLTMYCETWSRYVSMLVQAEETGGEIVKSPSGFPILNPYAAARNQARKQLLVLAREFGLTASSKVDLRADRPSLRPKLSDFARK